MAKVIFEFKSDFTKHVDKGVMDGFSASVEVEFDDDKKTSAGLLALVMGDIRKELIQMGMDELVKRLHENGMPAQHGVYAGEATQH